MLREGEGEWREGGREGGREMRGWGAREHTLEY